MVIFLCWSWVVHHIRHCNILGAWEWPATETVCFSPLKKTTHLEAWQSPTRCLAAPCPCTSSWEAQCLQWCWGSFQAWRLQFQNCFNFSLEISKIYYDKVVKDIRQWHIFYTCFILDTLYLIFETLAYIYIYTHKTINVGSISHYIATPQLAPCSGLYRTIWIHRSQVAAVVKLQRGAPAGVPPLCVACGAAGDGWRLMYDVRHVSLSLSFFGVYIDSNYINHDM